MAMIGFYEHWTVEPLFDICRNVSIELPDWARNDMFLWATFLQVLSALVVAICLATNRFSKKSRPGVLMSYSSVYQNV